MDTMIIIYITHTKKRQIFFKKKLLTFFFIIAKFCLMQDWIGKEVWVVKNNIGKLDVFTDGEFVMLKKVIIDGIKFCEGNNFYLMSGDLQFAENEIYKNFEDAYKSFLIAKAKILSK